MIIDIILDRKDGEHYNARDFYYGVMDYENNLDNNYPISIAMDSGTNDDVIRALCNYVIINEYNPNICDWIKTQIWVED